MMPTLVSVKAFLCIFLFSDIASAVVNQNQDPDALTNANPLRKVDLAVYPAVRRRRQFASPWEQMTNTLKYEARKMYFPRHLELHVGDTAFTIFAPRNQGPTTSVPVPPPAPARQKKSRKFRIRFGIGFPGNNAERNDEQDSIQSSENAEEVVPEEEPADEEITRNLSQISVFNLIQRSFRRQSSIQSTADPMSSEANPEQLPTQQIQTRPVAKSNRVFGFDLTKKITMCYTTQTDEEILDWLATHWKGYYDEALQYVCRFTCVEPG